MGTLMFLLLCSRTKRVLLGELDEDRAHDTVDCLQSRRVQPSRYNTNSDNSAQ